MASWTTSEMPPLRGRTAVVTGTGGLGFECALALARGGAEVVVAGRDPAKGADAVARIRAGTPAGAARFERVDLAELGSVADFAARLRGRMAGLDLLINNAGVMVPPIRRETHDGFELQFGTNHLGHFALTAGLLPLLRAGRGARVVSVSSIAARGGAIDFGDLQAERAYRPMRSYSQSKLACLMFALELQRRAAAGGWGITSLAAHPGISRTDLLHNGPGRRSPIGISRTLLWFLYQPAAQGALPILFAATSPDAEAGAYYGPHLLSETRGYPAPARVPARASDEAVAGRLWDVSEALTGVAFPPAEAGRAEAAHGLA